VTRALATVLAVAAAACSAPHYGNGHLQCAASGHACPAGFYCAGDHHCWLPGTAPDLAVAPDLSVAGSRCARLGVLLCDGFEAPALASQWFADEVLGTVAVDGTRAYRGTQSLHAHHDATPATTRVVAAASETRTFPITGTIYVRAWAWFAGAFPATTLQPLILDTFSGAGGDSYVIDNGHPGINDYGTPSGYAVSGKTMVPTDRWTCLQLEVTQTAATGTTRIYLDGNMLDVSPLSAGTPSMAALRVGFAFYMPPALPAADAWIDEVIVDDKPTTCDE
jgi:hypothetical protein